MHGTPGVRHNRPPDEQMLRELGARVITYDRPGYGRSDRHAARSIVDCVGDVSAIAEYLEIDRFAVTGSSGGGPHVLAVAARRPDAVVRARCNVGLAPFGARDLDFFAGMDPLNVEEFGWAMKGEAQLVPQLQRQLEEMRVRMSLDPTKFLGSDWELDDSDRAMFAEPAIVDQNLQITAELVRGGVWGWVDDSLAFVRDWGFDVNEIQVPVRVTYGLRDVVVPSAHGEWLGRHVPGAEILVDDALGHLSPTAQIEASIRWLVSGH
jgi:pimeloyl-ACP methyl ester carboxylesterase